MNLIKFPSKILRRNFTNECFLQFLIPVSLRFCWLTHLCQKTMRRGSHQFLNFLQGRIKKNKTQQILQSNYREFFASLISLQNDCHFPSLTLFVENCRKSSRLTETIILIDCSLRFDYFHLSGLLTQPFSLKIRHNFTLYSQYFNVS